jgi:hypothetical protein
MKLLIFPIAAVAALIFVGGARADTAPSRPPPATPGLLHLGARAADHPNLQQQMASEGDVAPGGLWRRRAGRVEIGGW